MNPIVLILIILLVLAAFGGLPSLGLVTSATSRRASSGSSS